MLAIIYWNVHKGKGTNLPDAVVELATATVGDAIIAGADGEVLLCFSEPANVDFDAILEILQTRHSAKKWWKQVSLSGRFVCLGTIPQATLQLAGEVQGSLPCTLIRTGADGTELQKYEIWFVHFPAPIHVWMPLEVSRIAAEDFRVAVEAREGLMKHNRSIAIGDFNMEPFNPAMMGPTGLNATACSSVASKVYKTINENKKVQYFFNPMWTFLGSWSWLPSRQPGTFFKRDKTIANEWHLIDHILVRPSLIGTIQPGTPQILVTAGSIPLINSNGRIAKVSDHLPVLVTLDI